MHLLLNKQVKQNPGESFDERKNSCAGIATATMAMKQGAR
jgi:hypothetical protein